MRARATALFILGCLAGLAVGARPARAQQVQGFAVDRFDPSERGSDWFALESLDLRGYGKPAVGVVGDYAYRPLVVYNPDGSVGASIVRDQLILHPGASVVLWDRLRFGLDLPVAVVQQGRDVSLGGSSFTAPTGAGLGDLRLAADVRLLGEYQQPFTLAAGLAVYLPTGSRSEFTGDGTARAEPRLLAAGRIGAFLYSAKLALDYRPLDDVYGSTQLGSELAFGAAAGVKVLEDRLTVGPELYGSTVLGGNDGAFARRNTPTELLLGGHLRFAEDFVVGIGGGSGLTRGLGSPEVRGVVSLEWAPGYDLPAPPDRDSDGVPDSEDSCPDAPGIRTNDPKTNGCPSVVVSDRDRDGIVDREDACPDVPGVKTSDPKTSGCLPDRDHDGIPDPSDACPEEPGPTSSDPKTAGCPADRDHDGILGAEDACPDSPGPKNTDPKKNGCPLAAVKEGLIVIREQIKFRLNKADLDPASNSVLEAVLSVLTAHPEIRKVRIEGHTDSQGSADHNLKLSKARALSVLKWLVGHGVAAPRLESQGYGMTHPIADNSTDDGRRDNRRVEFHIVDNERTDPESGK